MFVKPKSQSVRPAGKPALSVRSRVKAGHLAGNRCEEVAAGKTLRVRSRVKAGHLAGNRCEAVARA